MRVLLILSINFVHLSPKYAMPISVAIISDARQFDFQVGFSELLLLVII